MTYLILSDGMTFEEKAIGLASYVASWSLALEPPYELDYSGSKY